MKRIVFVYSKKGIDRLIEYSNKNNCTIVSLTTEADFVLDKNNVDYRTPLHYGIKPVEYKKIWLERQKLFADWGKIKLDNKQVSDLLTLNGISQWKSVEEEIGEINLDFIVIYLRVVQEIIEKAKPSIIITNDMSNIYYVPRDKIFFPNLIRSVAQTKNIPVKFTNRKSYGRLLLQKIVDKSLVYVKIIRDFQRRDLSNYKNRKGKTVLFFHQGFAMEKFDPIRNKLESEGINTIAICTEGIQSRDDVAKHYDKKSLMYAYYESFVDKRIKKRTKHLNKKYINMWKQINKQRIKFSHRGVDLIPVFAHQFGCLFNHRFADLTLMILAIESIFKDIKPELIVNTNDSSIVIGRVSVLLANKHNVRSLLMQHAKAIDFPCRYEVLSDSVATWQQVKEEELYGKPPLEKFVVTGTSKQKAMQKEMKTYKKKSVLKELGLPQNTRIVLFVSRFPVTRDILRIKDFAEILKDKEDFVGIVKVHPAETSMSSDELEGLFSDSNIIYKKDRSFVKLLAVCEFVITTDGCTSSSDSIMVEKPMIIVDYDYEFDQTIEDHPDYGQNPPFFRANNKNELNEYVDKLLYDDKAGYMLLKKMKSYNKKNNNYNANSEKNLANYIQELLNKGEEIS